MRPHLCLILAMSCSSTLEQSMVPASAEVAVSPQYLELDPPVDECQTIEFVLSGWGRLQAVHWEALSGDSLDIVVPDRMDMDFSGERSLWLEHCPRTPDPTVGLLTFEIYNVDDPVVFITESAP